MKRLAVEKFNLAFTRIGDTLDKNPEKFRR
jgi:hypothetical protein